LDIEKIIEDRKKWLNWKNIAPLREKLNELPLIENVDISLDQCITISSDALSNAQKKSIGDLAWEMRPWRKGPFKLFDTFIDSEWKSFIKYDLLCEHFDIKDKKVADIGCNNGYYMFRMLKAKPKSITGFDPSALFKTQFDLIERYIKSGIRYELLGVEHLPYYHEKFDTIFCLGVLYHRSDPIETLKSLYKGLEKNGELLLDTFMIDGEEEVALCPKSRYSKIPNVYFVPTISCLKNWLERARFHDFEILQIKKTELNEQRKTEWIEGESLNNFLDPNDPELTVEGYPAPKRVYIKAKKG
jgi:tRNA (mo5U34)-methyltransferase